MASTTSTSPSLITVAITVDGEAREVEVEPRTTLLDALRERLGENAPKKGCDHGQCGSCTVLLDGRRHLTCLTLAVQHDGADVVTAAGLGRLADGGDADPDGLHPVQRAFVDRDGLQCGYCTPGQVCSAVGALDEIAAGHPSHVTEDLEGEVEASEVEVRERLSGNICRCGAYSNIIDAVRQAAGSSPPDRVAAALAATEQRVGPGAAAGPGSDTKEQSS